MEKYTKPEIKIDEFEATDVIMTSDGGSEKLELWGSNLKTVDSAEIDVFE